MVNQVTTTRNRVRAKLDAGESVLGAALQIDSPWLVEIVALAGFDYVLLDGEHGFALGSLPVLIMAAQGAGIVPIVRVPSHDRGFLLQALEAGAGGVQVPMVNTPAEARRLVEEVKYAPLGRRGFSGATRAARYGALTSEDHASAANRDTLLVAHLETAQAVEAAAEIAAETAETGSAVHDPHTSPAGRICNQTMIEFHTAQKGLLPALKTQVLVVGSGAAGLLAALAAGRNGADVTLVEYQGFVGGISATLPWIGFHDQDYRLVVKGIPLEIVRRLQGAGEAGQFGLDPKLGSVVSVNNHYYKCLAIELLKQAGVRLMLHTHVVDTLREGDRIAGVVVEHKSGRQHLLADVVIDCSGDGDVAARGGAAWEKGRTADGLVQSPTLVFRIGNVDRDALIRGCQDWRFVYREWFDPYPDLRDRFLAQLPSLDTFVFGGFATLVKKAIDAGELRSPQTRIIGVKTHVRDEFCAVTTRILGLDPTDVTNLTHAYEDVYQQIPEHLAMFRKYIPGFSQATLRDVAPMLGVRESRRIMGEYVMSLSNVVDGTQLNDVVAMGGYHVDIHRPDGTWVNSADVQAYDIPFRSLVARDLQNLLMAGKCLSATHEAVASTRVIPICMAQGQAVGTAAALAVRRGQAPRDVPIRELQNTLIDQGAELRQTLGEPDQRLIDRYGQLPKKRHLDAFLVNGKSVSPPSPEPAQVPAEQWVR